MKFGYFFLVILLFGCQSSNQSNKNNSYNSFATNTQKKISIAKYTGSWFWKSVDSSSSFKIVLFQIEDSLYGQYCAAYNFGNRMDCDFDTSYNLNGKIQSDTAILNFSSFYRAKNGKASLKITGETMTWKILVWPENGDCYAPEKALLTKQKW